MGLFAKLFGSSTSSAPSPTIPEGTTGRELIRIAVQAVIDRAGGNCAHLEARAAPTAWMQVMDLVINAHYPHAEHPSTRFPELCHNPLVASLDHFEPHTCMTVGLGTMDPASVADWIERYLQQVLALDPDQCGLELRMEEF